jgi:hypothetical protein
MIFAADPDLLYVERLSGSHSAEPSRQRSTESKDS